MLISATIYANGDFKQELEAFGYEVDIVKVEPVPRVKVETLIDISAGSVKGLFELRRRVMDITGLEESEIRITL